MGSVAAADLAGNKKGREPQKKCAHGLCRFQIKRFQLVDTLHPGNIIGAVGRRSAIVGDQENHDS